MKKNLLFLLFFAGYCSAMAQAIQPCIVQQYNQKDEKTPLSGVEITVSDAGSAVSDKSGALDLVFRTLKAGSKVKLLSADKSGYEVFNKSDIAQWNISRDGTPYYIVMVESRKMAEYKEQLTRVSTDSYRKKYHQAIREVEELKQKGKLRESEYNNRLDELENKYQADLKNLENYIDQFAHIDLNKVSKEEERILEMVDNGLIDEAVKAYDALDITGKLRKARGNTASLKEAKNKIDLEVSKQEELVRDLKEKQKREIATLKMAGGKKNYDKVAVMLRENAQADTTDFWELIDYAVFSIEQHDFSEAEKYELRCLELLYSENGPFEAGSPAQKEEIGAVQHDLATIYASTKDYPLAKEWTLKALNEYQELFEESPDTYRYDLAFALGNAGGITILNKDYDFGEKLLQESLKHLSILVKKDKAIYQYGFARSQSFLGAFYFSIKDYHKAEQYLLSSIENMEQSLLRGGADNPDERMSVIMNLGALYSEMKDFDKAEKYLISAVDSYSRLFRDNPDAYREQLSLALNNLSVNYMHKKLNDKAKGYLLESISHTECLFKLNPEAYRDELALRQTNLGAILSSERQFTEAEKIFLSAENNRILLVQRNSEIYKEPLASTRFNLAELFWASNQFDKAEEYGLKALNAYEELFNENPEIFRSSLAKTLALCGRVNTKEKKYVTAVEHYKKALEHYKVLYSQEPSIYRLGIAGLQSDYGYSLTLCQKYDEAEIHLHEAESLLMPLFLQDSFLYGQEMSEIKKGLGTVYLSDGRLAEAENSLLEAHGILMNISQDNPKSYQYPIADVEYVLGNLYQHKNDVAEAEKFFSKSRDRYVGLCKDNPSAYRPHLAKTQLDWGAWCVNREDYVQAEMILDEACQNYRILFEQYPDIYRSDLANTLSLLGTAYMNQGGIDRSQSLLEQSLDLFSLLGDEDSVAQAQALDNLAAIYAMKGDSKKSEGLFLEALHRIDMKNGVSNKDLLANIKNNLCAVYLGDGQTEKAMPLLTELLSDYTALFEKSPEKYRGKITTIQINLGHIYLNDGQFDKAVNLFIQASANARNLVQEDAENSRPIFAEALYYLASANMQLGDIKGALDNYHQSLEQWGILYKYNPDLYMQEYAMAQNDMALAYLQLGDYPKAEEHLLETLQKNSILFEKGLDDGTSLMLTEANLGQLYGQMGDYIKAGIYYQRSMTHCQTAMNSGNQSLISNLANIQFYLVSVYGLGGGTYRQYDAMIDEALKTNGTIYENNGQNKDKYLDLLLRKAVRLIEKGKLKDAITYQEQAYEISPDKTVGDQLAARCYELALSLSRIGDYPRALEYIDTAIKLFQEESTFVLSKGEILMKAGDANSALEMWYKVVQMDPTCQEGWGKSSLLYKQLVSCGLLNE